MTRWQFIKNNKWMFIIGATIIVVAAVTIIYAVATHEGDVSFAVRDGHQLRWKKEGLPVGCFYEEGFAQLQQYDAARKIFNTSTGLQLLSPCMPWRINKPMPHHIIGTLTLHVGKPPSAQKDGIEVDDPFKSHPGAVTELKYDKRTGELQSAATYIDPAAPKDELEHIWVHEMGHVLGLDHDRLKDSVMYPTLDSRGRKPSAPDVKALQGAYR